MAVTPYIFDGGALTASAVLQGEAVPASTRRVIKAATICNTTGAPITATVHLVKSGGTPDATNTYISARAIAAGESYTCPELVNQGLSAGGAVYALGNGLTFKYTAVDFV